MSAFVEAHIAPWMTRVAVFGGEALVMTEAAIAEQHGHFDTRGKYPAFDVLKAPWPFLVDEVCCEFPHHMATTRGRIVLYSGESRTDALAAFDEAERELLEATL